MQRNAITLHFSSNCKIHVFHRLILTWLSLLNMIRSGENIFPTIGSLNHITDEHIQTAHIPYEILRRVIQCAVFLEARINVINLMIMMRKLATDLKIFMT